MNIAYVGRIEKLMPIEGADRIVSAEVVCGPGGKWRGTVRKDQFNEGDYVTVFLQDALLPEESPYFDFSFMERHHYIVKMAKFKGVPSECLIMPYIFGKLGEEVSDYFHVTKYEKPLPATLSGDAYGWFPSFIPKTDQPNFQTVPEMIDALQWRDYVSTVKADGSSVTFYKTEDGQHFGCCSRNIELKPNPNNSLWLMAEKYHLQDIIEPGFAVQAELVGPGIQGNPMGLKEVDILVFDLFDIRTQHYHAFIDVIAFCVAHDIPGVFLDHKGFWEYSSEDMDAIRLMANGIYETNKKPREGVVIRPLYDRMYVDGKRLSFKVINLDYKG